MALSSNQPSQHHTTQKSPYRSYLFRRRTRRHAPPPESANPSTLTVDIVATTLRESAAKPEVTDWSSIGALRETVHGHCRRHARRSPQEPEFVPSASLPSPAAAVPHSPPVADRSSHSADRRAPPRIRSTPEADGAAASSLAAAGLRPQQPLHQIRVRHREHNLRREELFLRSRTLPETRRTTSSQSLLAACTFRAGAAASSPVRRHPIVHAAGNTTRRRPACHRRGRCSSPSTEDRFSVQPAGVTTRRRTPIRHLAAALSPIPLPLLSLASAAALTNHRKPPCAVIAAHKLPLPLLFEEIA